MEGGEGGRDGGDGGAGDQTGSDGVNVEGGCGEWRKMVVRRVAVDKGRWAVEVEGCVS